MEQSPTASSCRRVLCLRPAALTPAHPPPTPQEFLYAASRGDNNCLRRMLQQGFDVNAADYGGCPSP